MIRSINSFGLALIAVAAISVASASMAHAAQFHGTSSKNVTITGHQKAENIFQLTTSLAEDKGPKAKCSQATFESTAPNQGGSQVTGQELTVTPIYSNCTAFGQAATIKMNGCHFTATGAGQPALTMAVDIVCQTAGKQIEVTTAICQFKIPAQTTGGHIVFKNVAGSPHTVEVVKTINTIKHEYSAGIGCAHTKNVTTTDADYEGTAHFQAYEDLGTEQVQRGDGHLYIVHKHAGVPLGVEAT